MCSLPTRPAPSRSAFFAGMYQTTTDTHPMRSHRSDAFRLPPGVRPITHWLRDAGYFTANIKTIGDRRVGTGKLDLNFVNEGPIYESDDWSAIQSRQPFFAVVNSPEVEYDIYDRQSAQKPRVEWVGEREHPRIATPENVTPPPYYPDHPVVRQEWARYLNSVSGMDRRIGWVLEQLRADGLEDDTVILFFADNGRLEARGIHWCYDTGLHVPMIVRWPKNFPVPPQIRPGAVNEQVISLLDVTATTLAIGGVPRPPLMQSRSFLARPANHPGSTRSAPATESTRPSNASARWRRPLALHSQLHPRSDVRFAQSLQGEMLPGHPADARVADAGQTDRPARGVDVPARTQRGTLRPGGRPARDPEPRPFHPGRTP